MKIYDAIIFNNELELLQLRLSFLYNSVDFFVIVESARTMSGLKKPLYFADNKHLFQSYLDKIIYVEAPVKDLPTWEYEFFQRNEIKRGLLQCNDDDLIIISDVDEIINLPALLPELKALDHPALIKTFMYYYWLNLKTNADWYYVFSGRWRDIKTIDIGDRYESLHKKFPRLQTAHHITGWHFSYLFGTNIAKYQNKIVSFSHQGYNNKYFLNARRIKRCINLGIDIFERRYIKMKFSDEELGPILPYIHQAGLSSLLFKPSFLQYLDIGNLAYLFKYKVVNKLAETPFFSKKEKND